MLNAFDAGSADAFVLLWEKHIPLSSRKGADGRAMLFYLHLHFAVFPLAQQTTRRLVRASRASPFCHATNDILGLSSQKHRTNHRNARGPELFVAQSNRHPTGARYETRWTVSHAFYLPKVGTCETQSLYPTLLFPMFPTPGRIPRFGTSSNQTKGSKLMVPARAALSRMRTAFIAMHGVRICVTASSASSF